MGEGRGEGDELLEGGKNPSPWMGEGRVRVTKLVKSRHSRAGGNPEFKKLVSAWAKPGFLYGKHTIHCSGN
jgi:hypothetical protein